MRVHRNYFERLIYSEVFRCPKCDNRVSATHPYARVTLRFIFSRHTHCIRCGTPFVQRSTKRDRVDSISSHVLGRVQRVLGAPLNKCVACRLQYYDWRPVKKEQEQGKGKKTEE